MTTIADNYNTSSGNNVVTDAKLVHEVEKHPALYNPKKRGYKDAAEMDRSWLQIANELGMKQTTSHTCTKQTAVLLLCMVWSSAERRAGKHDALDVKNRWRCLRDKFVREKKRLVLDGEAAYRCRDPWPLLDDMSFLWEFINHRKDVYTRKMSAKIRGEYIQQNLQPILPRPSPERANVELETSEASPSHAFQSATTSKMLNFPASGIDNEPMRIKRDINDRDDDFVDDGPPTSRLRSLLNQTTQDESSEDIQQCNLYADPSVPHKLTSDEDELFCLSVAASLRRFNPQKKALAKLRIQQVLYDVELLN